MFGCLFADSQIHNNNNNFICIAVYTKALYRFTIKKKKITNNSTKTKKSNESESKKISFQSRFKNIN